MELWHGVVVVREVGHELVLIIAVAYKMEVIVVVGKVHNNNRQRIYM